MPASDPSHTASSDPRKEELAALFEQWDREGAPAVQRASGEALGLWLRGGITLALIAGAAVVLHVTRAEVAFWAEPSASRELWDLREDYVQSGGARTLGPDNGYVSLRGLVPTRLVPVMDAREPSSATATASLFFCPLRGIVVLTPQALTITPEMAKDADPRLTRLVNEGQALPEETALSVAVTGRLLRGDRAPPELDPFVRSFARRLQEAPGDLWVLLDGVRPSDASWAVVVWALALTAPLLSLVFFVRALRQRPRREAATS